MANLKRRKSGGKTNAAGRKLMAALRELHHAVMTGDTSKHTIREVEISEPGQYRASDVRALRSAMNVSQGVFAAMIGVSPALVQHWEHGIRGPGLLARRLLDQVRENPGKYARSVMQRKSA